MIEKMKNRPKKAIENNIQKLCEKYGFDETRIVANHFFTKVVNKNKLQKEIEQKEKELLELKK